MLRLQTCKERENAGVASRCYVHSSSCVPHLPLSFAPPVSLADLDLGSGEVKCSPSSTPGCGEGRYSYVLRAASCELRLATVRLSAGGVPRGAGRCARTPTLRNIFQPSAITDPAAPRSRLQQSPGFGHSCGSCGRRFDRLKDGQVYVASCAERSAAGDGGGASAAAQPDGPPVDGQHGGSGHLDSDGGERCCRTPLFTSSVR